MRYREDQIPADQLASHASDGMLLLTAILATLIGIAITIMGRKGKQMWMWVWGLGLIVISLYMTTSLLTGYRLFEHF